MIRTLTCIALVAAGAFLAWPHQAQAAQSYDNCTGFISSLPATISTQGTWCLNQNLATAMSSGDAITIATNNVTIDCNHFKIGGLAAGLGTTASGIRAATRFNATVRNCNIRGFYRGIYFTGGGGHLIEDSSFDGNTFQGVYTSSPGSTIRNSLVINTGGSTASTSDARGVYAVGGVDVINNTVNGVTPTGTNASAYGIFTDSNGDGSISGNRIRAVFPTGTGLVAGIYTFNSGRGVIRGNDVQGAGVGGVGVSCSTNRATARDNVIVGFGTAVDTCFSSSNAENPN